MSRRLSTIYTPPEVPSGHDFLHVNRMIRLGDEIKTFLNFDRDEYITAVWLHNLDRARDFKVEASNPEKFRRKLREYCLKFLEDSPFTEEEQERIITAVVEHNKRDDERGDSTLLQALRIADKVDRFRSATSTIFAIGAHRKLLAYDPEKPFGYFSTEEGKLITLYNDIFRVLEWYKMLPSDEARALIRSEDRKFFLRFLRRFGQEIAEHLQVKNRVEEDIRKALRGYFLEFRS